MTVYRTGRSADYIVAPEQKQAKPKPRPLNHTDDAIAQFERMGRGFVPRCSEGSAIVWVRDDTLTHAEREWCWQTAQQIRRDADLARVQRRAQEPPTRTTDQVEQAVAAVLARRPDATAHEVRMITGIAHSRVLRTEAWILAHMDREAKAAAR